MNAFYEHHHDSLIQPFQQPARVVGFFNTYREHIP